MIDWWGLFHNALWVAGLAVVLATASVASYHAAATGSRLRQAIVLPGFEKTLMLGLALASVGWALGDGLWWERAVWGLLALYFAASAALIWWKQGRRGTAG